jgi:GxxExxY protein
MKGREHLLEGKGGGMGKWRKEELTEKIIGACINVHKALGPGFLEIIYFNALVVELKKQGISFESEKDIHVLYDGIQVGIHKVDLLIEGEIVVELKAVDELNRKHYAQLRSYLSALNSAFGLLVNFSGSTLDVRRVEVAKLG